MPRRARQDYDGCRHFHVMVQGIGKENVFEGDKYKNFYLSCLKKHKNKYSVKILAYCIMDNHAHVLLSVDSIEALSQYIKAVGEDYARYFNWSQNRVGYVFRGRFKSEAIRDEKHLVYCVAYIQNNPLKAGMVDNAEEYKYSSYQDYLKSEGLVNFEEASIFYDTDPENMRAIMAERTDRLWLEHEFCSITTQGIVNAVELKYKNNPKDNITLCLMAKEIKAKTGASIKSIAEWLNVCKQKLARVMARDKLDC
ncbi:MAG: transposase [Firmicutes bacterium]|nr:transposase [Bacillota bacterium]